MHIHSFCDSAEQATWYLKEFPNAYFGLTGAVCFDDSGITRSSWHWQIEDQLRETVKKIIPLNRILFETDGPYMTPPPYPASKWYDVSQVYTIPESTCHSGYIPVIAQKIAELKGVSLEEVMKQVRENTKAMYGIW